MKPKSYSDQCTEDVLTMILAEITNRRLLLDGCKRQLVEGLRSGNIKPSDWIEWATESLQWEGTGGEQSSASQEPDA